jgi:hypothetical protein
MGYRRSSRCDDERAAGALDAATEEADDIGLVAPVLEQARTLCARI